MRWSTGSRATCWDAKTPQKHGHHAAHLGTVLARRLGVRVEIITCGTSRDVIKDHPHTAHRLRTTIMPGKDGVRGLPAKGGVARAEQAAGGQARRAVSLGSPASTLYAVRPRVPRRKSARTTCRVRGTLTGYLPRLANQDGRHYPLIAHNQATRSCGIGAQGERNFTGAHIARRGS